MLGVSASFDHEQTLILLGNAAVGKTSLAVSLCGQEFNSNEMALTKGIDITSFESGQRINIIDFGGQQIYDGKYLDTLKSVTSSILIIAVDPRHGSPQEDIDYWHSVVEKNPIQHIEKHLVVTKSDLMRIYLDEKKNLDTYGFKKIHNVSAATGEGVHELRSSLLEGFISLNDASEEEPEEIEVIVRDMIDRLCKLVARNPDILMDIEWRDLERLISHALSGLGFDAELTPPSKDGGKDVIAKCIINNRKNVFYVEIKHWKSGKKPDTKTINDFVQVNAVNCTDGGLFLSSSGFSNTIYSEIAELMKQKVRLGDKNKIVSLCQRYVSKNGVWRFKTLLPELLFEDVI